MPLESKKEEKKVEPEAKALELLVKCTNVEMIDTAVIVMEGEPPQPHSCIRKVGIYRFESKADHETPEVDVVVKTLGNAFFERGKLYRLELK